MTHDSKPQQQGEADSSSLADSDAGLARVTEDLIDILITRGLIQFTDFPRRPRPNCCSGARPGK